MNFNHLNALVVDDDEAVRVIVNNRLKHLGIKSTCVTTGSEAIQKLSQEKFDFVIMDISMPEQDGLDAVRWIRDLDDKTKKDLPIFALTSYSTSDHTQEILTAGFNEHLVKPLQVDQLVTILKKYFWKPE
jgi:CheY-like chemotaxis protein